VLHTAIGGYYVVTKKEFVEWNWRWTMIPFGIMFVLSILGLIYSATIYLFGPPEMFDSGLVKFCGIIVLFSGPFYVLARYIKSAVLSAIGEKP